MKPLFVVASEAKQSSFLFGLGCRVAALLAMTVSWEGGDDA